MTDGLIPYVLERSDLTKLTKAIGIGEVLLDHFENGDVTVGGAPLNVTFHLNQIMNTLGAGEAQFITRVGKDQAADRILAYLQKAGMNTRFVSKDEHLPTGAAFVFTDAGHAGFEIAQHSAWDATEEDASIIDFAMRASAVVFGSLAQRSSPSCRTIRHVVAAAKGERLYDVNLRRNTRSKIAGYTEEIVRSSLELATIVKLNDEELEEVATMLGYPSAISDGEEQQWMLMSLLANQFHLSVVALTRGPKGAFALCDGKRFRLKDSILPQDQVHPVGAGDAFAAGLLFGRMAGWQITVCLELAESMADWVVRHVSATPRLSADMRQNIIALSGRATNVSGLRIP